MEIKTRLELFKNEGCNPEEATHLLKDKWIKIDDEKLRISEIIELIKIICIKNHKIDETEHCYCDNFILLLLKHYDELSQSSLDKKVK